MARADADARKADTDELLQRHKEMRAEFDKEHRQLQYQLVQAQWAEDRASCAHAPARRKGLGACMADEGPPGAEGILVGR